VIEALGLLVIIGVGLLIAAQADSAELLNRLTPEPGLAPILSGATLAFYAFVGFEDLANLAEEVKNPERDLPRAILAAVAVTTVIYVLVIIVVLWTLPIPEAATSARPLLDVLYAGGMPLPAPVFAVLAIFAISNTGLANFVMVSRLLYGMAGQGLLPPALARVHAVRQTPSVAIIISAALAFLLVVTGGVRLLAQTTSLLLVIVFSVVHVSLIRIRSRSKAPPNAFRVPRLVPWAGLIVCGFLVAYFPLDAFVRAGIIVSVGGAVYGLYGKWR
jgi:amino acid transporter